MSGYRRSQSTAGSGEGGAVTDARGVLIRRRLISTGQAGEMTLAEERQLFNLVQWRMRGYRSEADWEDILGESLLLAWRCYQQQRSLAPGRRLAVSVAAARYGYVAWLRRWHGRDDRAPLQVRQEPPCLSMVDLHVSVPDFTGEVIRRVDGERLWERIQALCAPRQRQVLERVLFHGESFGECAKALGIRDTDAWKYYRNALRKCREALVI